MWQGAKEEVLKPPPKERSGARPSHRPSTKRGDARHRENVVSAKRVLWLGATLCNMRSDRKSSSVSASGGSLNRAELHLVMGEPTRFEQYKDLADEEIAELLQYQMKDCLSQAQRYWRRSMGQESSKLLFTDRTSEPKGTSQPSRV